METLHGMVEMPDFGLSEEERRFSGPPSDRRALMHHRKWLQVRPRRPLSRMVRLPAALPGLMADLPREETRNCRQDRWQLSGVSSSCSSSRSSTAPPPCSLSSSVRVLAWRSDVGAVAEHGFVAGRAGRVGAAGRHPAGLAAAAAGPQGPRCTAQGACPPSPFSPGAVATPHSRPGAAPQALGDAPPV